MRQNSASSQLILLLLGLSGSLTAQASEDSDGVATDADSDDDNDGVPDYSEPLYRDDDGDGEDNNIDLDSDGDGVYDLYEIGGEAYDGDGDGRIDGGVNSYGIPSAVESGAGTVDCPDAGSLLTNAGFESPVISAGSYSFVAMASTGWTTTDSTGYIEIWSDGFNGVPSLEGNQFAELNAYYDAKLSQNAATTVGTEYILVTGHRARVGTDVARFLVDGVEMDRYTDTTADWGVYISSFTATATSTELGFESVSTGSGSSSVGNFFDVLGVYERCDFSDLDEDDTDDFLDEDDDDDGIDSIDEDADGDGDPSNDDADSDGTPNYQDTDSDDDGLGDIDELEYGTDPYDADTDDGGVSDGTEVDDDTDPNDGSDDILETCTADTTEVVTGEFTTSTLPTDWVIGGDAYLTAPSIDAEGDGWLRLTDASTNQTGYAFLDEPLDSCAGVVLSFEFAAYGGSGADGFSVFLFDGAYDSSTFSIGSDGGSLGYIGMESAYAGVGVDEYGNFASYTDAAGFSPNAITIAGAASDDWSGVATTGDDGVLDWDELSSRPIVTSSDYRQLFAVFEARRGDGYNIDVYLREGYDAVPELILSSTYRETEPESLKIGFAASTGSLTNVHEVGSVGFAALGEREVGDVRVTLEADNETPNPGDTVTLSFEVANRWGEDIADVTTSMSLPDWLESPTWTCADGDSSVCAGASGSGAVGTTEDIDSADALTFTVTGTIADVAYGDLEVSAAAALDADHLDIAPVDNEDSVTLSVPTYDFDGDGLSNEDEALEWGTDASLADTDGDGLEDGDEALVVGTDPLVADTDGDGLGDGDEVDVYGSDPLDTDTDDDGLGDGEEVSDWDTSPTDADSDDDGLSDGDEALDIGTDPLDADSDDDGLSDSDEHNDTGTDPLDADSDEDGLLDGEEVNSTGTDPLDADSDEDGLLDGEEVNSTGTDPLDADSDDDALSDGDEVNTTGTDPNDADSDDDALSDGDEVNSTSTDPNDADSDDDALSDGDEVNSTSTDPNDADSDDDALSDGDEVNSTGTDPLDADSDDDALSDGDEVNSTSTDPNDADSDDDALSDGDEVNSTSTDPNDADSDDDALSDGDEVNTHTTDPNDADTDDGGVPDGEEVDTGLDPLDPSDDVEAVDESGYYAGKGCGCATGTTPRASWLAPLLGLLFWRRRRDVKGR